MMRGPFGATGAASVGNERRAHLYITPLAGPHPVQCRASLQVRLRPARAN